MANVFHLRSASSALGLSVGERYSSRPQRQPPGRTGECQGIRYTDHCSTERRMVVLYLSFATPTLELLFAESDQSSDGGLPAIHTPYLLAKSNP